MAKSLTTTAHVAPTLAAFKRLITPGTRLHLVNHIRPSATRDAVVLRASTVDMVLTAPTAPNGSHLRYGRAAQYRPDADQPNVVHIDEGGEPLFTITILGDEPEPDTDTDTDTPADDYAVDYDADYDDADPATVYAHGDVVRLDDLGGLGSAYARQWRVVRVQPDGTLDLGYGIRTSVLICIDPARVTKITDPAEMIEPYRPGHPWNGFTPEQECTGQHDTDADPTAQAEHAGIVRTPCRPCAGIRASAHRAALREQADAPEQADGLSVAAVVATPDAPVNPAPARTSGRLTKEQRKIANRALAAEMRVQGFTPSGEQWTQAKAGTLAGFTPALATITA